MKRIVSNRVGIFLLSFTFCASVFPLALTNGHECDLRWVSPVHLDTISNSTITYVIAGEEDAHSSVTHDCPEERNNVISITPQSIASGGDQVYTIKGETITTGFCNIVWEWAANDPGCEGTCSGSCELTVSVAQGDLFECIDSFLLEPNNKEDLQTLRNFRDNFLSNSLTGLGLITLYYKHSAEVIGILNVHPELKSKATTTLKELVEFLTDPSLDSSVGNMVKYSIPVWLEKDVNDLIDELAKQGSNELKKAIKQARRSLYE